jgi:hypothetical protein
VQPCARKQRRVGGREQLANAERTAHAEAHHEARGWYGEHPAPKFRDLILPSVP